MSDYDEFQQRNRSPHYPYLSLDQAVNLLETFYKKYRLNKTPISLALKEVGYTYTSGAGKRVTAALTQFGLVDVEGTRDSRRISISNLGKSILMPNPTNPEQRIEAIRDAALRPEMHKWVYEQYGLDINPFPPDDQLFYDLVNERRFVENSVEGFVKEFKDTYIYAHLEPGSEVTPHTENDNRDIPITSSTIPAPQDKASVSLPNSDSRELTTSLTHGKVAHLIVPDGMNSMDFTILVKWLELLKEAALYEEQAGKP